MKVLSPRLLRTDPALAFASDALNPAHARPALEGLLGPLGGLSARLVRHKLGKRALIVYTVCTPSGVQKLFGKVRAKGTDRRTHALQQTLWQAGFSDTNEDGISVAETLGVLEPWKMTLQRAVPGQGFDVVLGRTRTLPPNLLAGIARAAHKLHKSGVATRVHTLADELAILERQLMVVATTVPSWQRPIRAVLKRCTRLASKLPTPEAVTLHRDFYPEQLKIAERRIYLLDLDLCARGDPALDIGNFTAHLSEFALRTHGDLSALSEVENELMEYFSILSGVPVASMQTYHTLSLARHIAISQRIPARRHLTGVLLESLVR